MTHRMSVVTDTLGRVQGGAPIFCLARLRLPYTTSGWKIQCVSSSSFDYNASDIEMLTVSLEDREYSAEEIAAMSHEVRACPVSDFPNRCSFLYRSDQKLPPL